LADIAYLHVGAPKTGTSYLQLLLWKNAQVLEERGVFLPAGSRKAQFDAVGDLRGGIWSNPRGAATWEELTKEIGSRPGRALVSEELLCASPADTIRTAVESLAPAEVHVICGVRDLARQIPAEWQQAVRGRSAMDYPSWLAGLRDDRERPFWQVQDPSRVAERWSAALPPENIHIITVPRAGSAAELLWDRFASVIGVDPGNVDAPSRPQNESLGPAETELLRRINERLGDELPLRQPYTAVVRDHLLRPGLLSAGGPKLNIPEEHHGWIRERSEQIASELRSLGVDVVGDSDELLATDFPGDANPLDLSDSDLLETSLDVWVRVLLHIEKDVVEAREQVRVRQGRRVARLQKRVAALESQLDAMRASRVYKLAQTVRRRLPSS